jgi:hypothetical protein
MSLTLHQDLDIRKPPYPVVVSLLTMANLPIFIPEFMQSELLTGDTFVDIRDRIQGQNWLSTDLVNEITDHSIVPYLG